MIHRDVPYDAEIEYLESTGTQYINTGILSTNAKIDISFKFNKVSGSSQVLINCGSNTIGWFGLSGNGKIVLNGQYFNINYSDKHDFTLEYKNGTIKATDEFGNSKQVAGVVNTNFTLLAVVGRRFPSYANLYYTKIYDNDTLVRDFIPVRKGNVGYMYDKVSGQLFGNSGTGSFILGPDVAPGRYANEVAFLESWGNQYIDTGIKPSTDTKIELKCLYCKSGAGLASYGSLIGADDRSNAYILNHSAVANFTYGLEFSNNFANPQTRLLTFNSTASPQNMRVYDEGGSLVTTLTCIRGVFEVNQNLYLFAVNRNGTPVYGSNRILYCKIYDGDTLVRDYVPVEYNGIGYMYDKVSGLFFDNKGTGKFLFGSIAKACARSYTRRQLMAKAPVPLERQYLTFKALESGTFTFTRNAVSYSLDGGITWNTLSAGTASPSVPVGKTIMWKGTITPGTTTGVGTFSATGSFNVLGNAMSLLFGANFARVKTLSGKAGAFYNLFLNNTKLVSAENLSLPALTMAQNGYRSMFQGCSNLVYPPQLPATTLAGSCYESMFRGCTSLVNAPQLHATTLAGSCYYSMFQGCTRLTTAPELPATTLIISCYYNMFQGCTSLTTAPSVLPATTLTNYCYQYMFQGCTSLTTAPELPATTLANNCYYSMFQGCTSLTTAPELPATTLINSCYQYMFRGCTSLVNAPQLHATTLAGSCYESMFRGCTALTTAPSVLPATTLTNYCYQYMFQGCTSLTTAPELPATTLANYCYANMFEGCTSLTTAPELPATTLASNCYNIMFRGCSSLNYIKAMFTTIPSNSTFSWVLGVASSGTFVKNSAATWDVRGMHGIPNNWTVQTADE